MKKLFASLTVAFVLLNVCVVSAQVKQTIKIPVEQVPLAVKATFDKDFSALPSDGYWMVYVETSHNSQRTTAKPEWYSYNKRSKGEKIEVRFTPAGIVTSTTGVERVNSQAGK